MTKPIKNYGKSVKTKLLNLMNSSGYKYMYLLARYFNERLLYRVSVSPYRENLLLKGGSLLYAFNGLETRPTIDIDFMAQRISRDRDSSRRSPDRCCAGRWAGCTSCLRRMCRRCGVSPRRRIRDRLCDPLPVRPQSG